MDGLRPEIAHLILDKLLTENGPGAADVQPVSLAGITTSSLSGKIFTNSGPNTSLRTFGSSSIKTVSQRCPRS